MLCGAAYGGISSYLKLRTEALVEIRYALRTEQVPGQVRESIAELLNRYWQ